MTHGLLDAIFEAEDRWKSSRDALAVTFLSVEAPLTLAVDVAQRSLPWLKASIFAAVAGLLLSILQKRWPRMPSRIVPGNRTFRPCLLALNWILGRIDRHGSLAATWMMVLALVALLTAVALR